MTQTTTTRRRTDVRKMTMTAMLAAVATVLMFISFSVPLMPSFIKLDFSELPALIASFAFGPLSGVTVCLIKNLVNLLFTTTGGVGELSNFVLGASFVFAAGTIYRMKKNRAGALIGAIAAKMLIAIGMPSELFGTCVLLAMCAFMGGTMRAPLTAAVFFIESTAQYTNIFFVGLVVFTVYFITTLFDRKPFYDMVLEEMFEQQNHGIKRRIVRFEAQISEHAFVIGKSVRDIMWPHGSIITAIIRADRNKRMMDDEGEKKLYVGDTIVFHVQLYQEDDVTEYLYDLVGRDHEIKISELQA
jgi:riboflavin transporter FmnP